MFLTRVTASFLATAALAAPVLSQGKPFKHALPAKTLAFFSVPDLNTSLGEFQKTAFAKMWRESEVQDFVADALKMGQAQWVEGRAQLKEMNEAGEFPISPDDLVKLRAQSVSGALTSVQIKMGGSQPEPRIGVLIHIDFGESAATWRKLANVGIEALLAQTQGMLEKSSSKLDGDVELITLKPPETDMSVNVAFVGSGIVIGSITDEVKDCVNAITNQKTILPVTDNYRATSKYLSTVGAEMEMFLDIDGLMNFAMDFLKLAEKEAPYWPEELQIEGIERAIVALGLRSMKTMGFTSKYEGNKAVTRGFVLAPEADRKGLFAGASTNLDLGFLKWVPKDIASLSATNLDIASIYDGLVGAIKAYNPEQADQLLGMLKEQEEKFGLSLKDDFFGVFGDQMVWWSMGVQNFMSAPEGAMLLKLKDQDKLLATLTKIAEMTGGMIEFPSSERKGIRTWRLELNPEAIDPQIAGALSFLQPCFAFKNGYMVMALATGDVRKAFKRMDREDDPKDDIRSNKEFAGYLATVQQQQISSFSWTDWRTSFENLYSAATSVIAFAVSADEVPFDLTLLPEAETLSQHLFSSAFWSTTNKEGYISTNISPVGPELFIGGVALGVGASLFLVGRTSESRGMDEGQEIIEEPVETKPKLMKKKGDKKGEAEKKGEAKKEVKKIK
jgi:hypothetical protein